MDTKPKICEGQMVPHTHKDDACEYRYLNGISELVGNLCTRCVSYERAQGYTLERTFIEEECTE